MNEISSNTVDLMKGIGPFRLHREGRRFRIDGPHGTFKWMKECCPFQAMIALIQTYKSWHEQTLLQRVYFIGESYEIGARVKIGISFDPRKRLSQLQVSNPNKISILAITYGGREEEVRLHSKYAHLSIGGEWFSVDKKLKDYIRNASLTLESHLVELSAGRRTRSDDEIIALLR